MVRATLHRLHRLFRDEWIEFTITYVVCASDATVGGLVQDQSRNLSEVNEESYKKYKKKL